MVAFFTPVDIGNRALQHVGSERITTSDFSENSKRCAEVAACYDKLRVAELQCNVWRFATRRVILRAIDTNTLLLSPSLWSASTTYFVGSIVSDSSGNLWSSRFPNNLNAQPGIVWSAWEPYFGPLTVMLYDSTTGYSAGELVYVVPGDGTYKVYVSLQNSNTDTPGTATAWDATVTYFKNQVATFSSIAYMSLIDLNLNQEPDLAPALWSAGTTYALGNKVGGSDGYIYSSVGSGNIGHDPTTDLGVHWTNTLVLNPWTTVFVGGSGSLKWLEIGGSDFPAGVSLAQLNISYPINSGPLSQTTTLNAYRLPSGFLKATSSDPKAGSQSFLGAPGGLQYRDWLFENSYIVTIETQPIVLRFVADVVDVSTMNALFCEGLAASIAKEVCEPLTQSTAKHETIEAAYERAIDKAKVQNAIEIGSEEPPVDDYIVCRL